MPQPRRIALDQRRGRAGPYSESSVVAEPRHGRAAALHHRARRALCAARRNVARGRLPACRPCTVTRRAARAARPGRAHVLPEPAARRDRRRPHHGECRLDGRRHDDQLLRPPARGSRGDAAARHRRGARAGTRRRPAHAADGRRNRLRLLAGAARRRVRTPPVGRTWRLRGDRPLRCDVPHAAVHRPAPRRADGRAALRSSGSGRVRHGQARAIALADLQPVGRHHGRVHGSGRARSALGARPSRAAPRSRRCVAPAAGRALPSCDGSCSQAVANDRQRRTRQRRTRAAVPRHDPRREPAARARADRRDEPVRRTAAAALRQLRARADRPVAVRASPVRHRRRAAHRFHGACRRGARPGAAARRCARPHRMAARRACT